MVRPAVDGWIVLFLVIAWGWNLPEGYLLKRCVHPFARAIIYCGLWHGWNMFAPDPLRVNRCWEARLHFEDGSCRRWTALDCGSLSLTQAFLAVRERKFLDNLVQPAMSPLRVAYCEYLARTHSTPSGRVTKVELLVNERAVPPPETPDRPNSWQQKLVCCLPCPEHALPGAARTAESLPSQSVDKTTR